jgi:uncharacterized damage-inducible protein DinB
MDEKALILKTREKEAPAMRKVFERIPEGSDYRPDPKSRTAREIAWLIVQEDIVLVEGIEKGKMEWTEMPAPSTMKEVLDIYDRHARTANERLGGVEAARWAQDIPFLFQGQEVMKASGYENAWGFLLDQIHHRGQISTYLRPMGSTVPQIYGPSADEPM